MCSPGASPAKDISVYWTDIELIQLLVNLLGKIPGFSLPSNVIDDVNPFQCEPSNLPGGNIWYLVVMPLKGSKQTKGGVWKEKGKASEIHTDSSFTGWRRTHEFLEEPLTTDGLKAGCWMMQEYWISCVDPIKQEGGPSSLCRVFLCDGEDGNTGLPNKGVTKAVPDRDSKPGQAPISAIQVENAREDDCFKAGDYLELADLVNSPSSSSSSDNSSAFSRVFDEFFNTDALLEELAHDDEAYSQPRPVCHQFNVSRPSDHVVLDVVSAASPQQEIAVPSPSIRVEESVATSAPDRGLLPDKDCNKRKAEMPASSSSDDVGASSSSGNTGASSSRQRAPGSERGKKVHVGKSMKKFFCFLAF